MSNGNKNGRELPACLYNPCKNKGIRYLVRSCTDVSDVERKQSLNDLADGRRKNGASRSSRSQTRTNLGSSYVPAGSRSAPPLTTGRRQKRDMTHPISPTSCSITVSDAIAQFAKTECRDDGIDETIVSPSLSKNAALREIGEATAIRWVRRTVALKPGAQPKPFSFTLSWTFPRTVLRLDTGSIALVNVTYFIADNDLACEDLLIGIFVLQHLQVDSCTLLENSIAFWMLRIASGFNRPAIVMDASPIS